jgi:hypothetical protein
MYSLYIKVFGVQFNDQGLSLREEHGGPKKALLILMCRTSIRRARVEGHTPRKK